MDSNLKYKFTNIASIDLEAILDYISINLFNYKSAEILKNRIRESIELMLLFPKMGKSIDGYEGIRKVVEGYILYYLYENDKNLITILRITNYKRDDKVILEQIKSTLN